MKIEIHGLRGFFRATVSNIDVNYTKEWTMTRWMNKKGEANEKEKEDREMEKFSSRPVTWSVEVELKTFCVGLPALIWLWPS